MNVFVFHKRQMQVAILCALLVAAVPLLAVAITRERLTTAGADNTNWGLSFQQEGQPPVGNASAEYLKPFGAYYVGDTGKKTLYITFDAGF